MRVFFTKNKKLIIPSLVFVVIVLLVSSVLLVNKYSINSTSIVGSDLKGYTTFKEKLNSLHLTNDPLYAKAIAKFNIVEDKNSLAQDRYNALAQAVFFLMNSYSKNNDPKIYNFIKNDFNTFAKDNFKNYYKQTDFTVVCQDPSCADSSAPKEIVNIINEINSLETISEAHKKMMILNLQYAVYFPSDNARSKAYSYLGVAHAIRTDQQFTTAGINNKIADEIDNFVKNTYPKYYIKLTP